MRIVFMGSPDFAVPSLDALVAAGHEVICVYTQPPRPAGRGKGEQKTAVHKRAEELGIEVRCPRTLRDPDEQARFATLDSDLAVVAAYGLILPKAILEAPRGGCINVHASLLPRWRGAAPIQRAILAGDGDTGVCIMQMNEGLDTGPVRLCKSSWIGHDTAGQVAGRLSQLGAQQLVKALANLDAYPPVAQPDEGVTYAPKISKSEARLDFNLPAEDLARKVRAFNPAPVAWFELGSERIRVLDARAIDRWDGAHEMPGTVVDLLNAQTSALRPSHLKHGDGIAIACGEGYLEVRQLQRPGGRPLSAADFLRGFPILEGTILP
jgi:methionyl-tRNA formyltransferase